MGNLPEVRQYRREVFSTDAFGFLNAVHVATAAVSTILIGTAAGSTIPRPEGGGDLVDDNGQVVTTYAHPEALQKIAAATGGKFYANPFGEHALDSLAASGGTVKQRNVRVPIERYQWPLAFACLAMFLGSVANRGAE